MDEVKIKQLFVVFHNPGRAISAKLKDKCLQLLGPRGQIIQKYAILLVQQDLRQTCVSCDASGRVTLSTCVFQENIFLNFNAYHELFIYLFLIFRNYNATYATIQYDQIMPCLFLI